jgi:hypothetical protein
MKTAVFWSLITMVSLAQLPARAEVPPAAVRRERQRTRIAEQTAALQAHQARARELLEADSARREARRAKARARLTESAARMEQRREQARQRFSGR